MTLHIAPLRPEDRAAWETLARGYKTFYKTAITPAEIDTAWQRLLKRDEVHAVGQAAREAGASRCYWLTHETNATARTLYDKVAKFQGFIRYDLPLQETA